MQGCIFRIGVALTPTYRLVCCADDGVQPAVRPVIEPVAEPFDLIDVRLLDGSLKQRQDLHLAHNDQRRSALLVLHAVTAGRLIKEDGLQWNIMVVPSSSPLTALSKKVTGLPFSSARGTAGGMGSLAMPRISCESSTLR